MSVKAHTVVSIPLHAGSENNATLQQDESRKRTSDFETENSANAKRGDIPNRPRKRLSIAVAAALAAGNERHDADLPVHFEFDVAVVGDWGVGKSSLVQCEVKDVSSLPPTEDAFVGIAFHSRVYREQWCLPLKAHAPIGAFEVPSTRVAEPIESTVSQHATSNPSALSKPAAESGCASRDESIRFERDRHSERESDESDDDAHSDTVTKNSLIMQQKMLSIRVNYWVAPGVEDYIDQTSRLVSSCAACIYVFNVNNRDTFEDVAVWMREIERWPTRRVDNVTMHSRTATKRLVSAPPRSSDMVRLIVGNKTKASVQATASNLSRDKADCNTTSSTSLPHGPRREVFVSEANAFARRFERVFYYETDATMGSNVSDAFRCVREEVLMNLVRRHNNSFVRIKRYAHELGRGIRAGSRLVSNLSLLPDRASLSKLLQTGDFTTHVDWL